MGTDGGVFEADAPTTRGYVEEDLQQAAAVLAASFAEESLFGYLLGGDIDTRRRLLLPLMKGMLVGHVPCSAVDLALVGETVVGTAITIRPDRFPVRAGDMLRIALKTLPAALRIAFSKPRILQLFKAASQMEANHPRDEPCWYLAFFGVLPGFRKRGAARILADEIFRRADEERVGCYLDTAGKTTMRMCRFLGFEVRHEISPFPDGPRCWGMYRAPKALA